VQIVDNGHYIIKGETMKIRFCKEYPSPLIVEDSIDAVHIEASGCTLEVTESVTGTQITIKQGSARIVNMAVVEDKPSRLYHYNDKGKPESIKYPSGYGGSSIGTGCF